MTGGWGILQGPEMTENPQGVSSAGGRERRITFLAVVTLLLASLAAACAALFGLAIWAPSMMAYSGAVESGANRDVMRAVLALMMAGPFVAAGGLVIGWITFFARRPGAGVMWVILPPMIWAGALLAYAEAIRIFCDDQFTCGL